MGLSSGCKISNSIAYLFDKFIPLIANDVLFAELNDGEKGN